MDDLCASVLCTLTDGSYQEGGHSMMLLAIIILIAVLRWMPRFADTVVHAFAGEQRSLMTRGFLRHGTRLRRTIELQTIVSRLAMITRMNLPLSPAVHAASLGEEGRMRQMLRKLAERLTQGDSVPAALESVVPGCPTQLRESLRDAESCGQLAGALEQQERMINSMIENQWKSTAHVRHAIVYASVMMLVCGFLVFGIVVVLVPKFKEIFLDFDVMLPGITMALLNLADWFAVHAWLLLMVFATAGLCTMLALTAGRRAGNQRVWVRGMAKLRSWFPMTHSMDHGLGMAKAIRAMILGIRSGMPNPFGRSYSPVISPTNSLRTRLDNFSEQVMNGVAPHDAARAARLGEVFVCALRMAGRGEDAERVLSHAADYYEAIAHRWWHALVAIAGPLVTVCMGFMVGFVALALFMPLIALIDSVSGAF